MELNNTRPAKLFARSRPGIECRHCGARLYIPEWSEFLDGGRARHLWQCEDCGCSFETTARFAAAERTALESA